jgi:hypothetical protein
MADFRAQAQRVRDARAFAFLFFDAATLLIADAAPPLLLRHFSLRARCNAAADAPMMPCFFFPLFMLPFEMRGMRSGTPRGGAMLAAAVFMAAALAMPPRDAVALRWLSARR